MFTPFILFLGLTVATAVIAHWSDNLGKKLGKKRVSLFGLRPRTTATILTVASSWGIMLFTLAALLIAFAPLRRALFSYDRERAKASLDRATAKREIGTARQLLTTTRTQYSSLSGQLSQTKVDLEKANFSVEKSRKAAQKAAEEGRKRANEARKRADEAEKAALKAQKRVVLAQKRFDLAQKREAAARKGELAAQGETRDAQRAAQTARELRNDAAIELKNSLASLKTAQSQLEATQKTLEIKSKSAFAAGRSAFAASRSVIAAQRQLYATKRQIAALETQRDALQNLAAATLSNDAPIKVRQTFAARVIPANQSPAAITIQLRAMLRQGQQSFAENEDISPTFPPDAKLQLLPLTAQDASGKPALLEGERLLQRLAHDIAASGQTTSIRLISPRNYLASEKLIETVFVAVPIAPAFEAAEILASTTIDGAQGDARIFRSLLDLTDLGRREAEKRGVNPPQSPDEPNFYAEGTNVRLFEALRRIEGSKARLRVNLVAAKALSTVEPLQVHFEIEEGALSGPTSSGPTS
ncbi:putative conserved protein, contains DUF3084 domain [Abditibacterium utsteinense]|uniref:Putative conserved protein, contains DUF3084 domain n=1 Tax=Abditibacterium utsteinense TaxID=1960156 RepID=A0A2S8SUW6_9BACT|nr:DUF3084 domain-containing protein [Abditibacterium utsteinense]PQV64583.1 putative conserved protein, contains DUF3084 domain [Abditibacterium utsteinense]